MRVAIVGAGKLGTSLTEALLSGGNEITLIDKDNELIQRAINRYDCKSLCANAKRSSVLKELNIHNYDLLISCADDDEKNIFIASMAKQMGCPKVVARVRGPEHVDQLESIRKYFGIDQVVNPDRSCAKEIYKYLVGKDSPSGGRFAVGDAEIIEIPIESMPGLTNKQLRETSAILDGLLIAAVSRNGKIIVPNGNTMLCEGDRLYIIGAKERAAKIDRKPYAVQDSRLRRVMIAGGGKTGYFLAEMLANHGVSVKVVESDKQRCNYLAERLNKVLVLNGDASDPVLLDEENLDDMDAFVAVTGFDEENLLLSLMANQHGIKDVVAKVSHKSYASLTETIGVNMTINPVDMCTASILKYINSNESILFSQMIQGQAEFIEAWANDEMALTGKSLADIEIPEGVLLAAVERGGDILIPKGSTVIQPGDKLVVLTLLSSESALEELLNKGRIHTV